MNLVAANRCRAEARAGRAPGAWRALARVRPYSHHHRRRDPEGRSGSRRNGTWLCPRQPCQFTRQPGAGPPSTSPSGN